MPLVTSKEMLLKAQKGGYAVGAFNAENMEMVKAIIQAAEELKAPVMIQTTPSTIKYGTVETYAAIVAAEAAKASVPVCLHLDHGSRHRPRRHGTQPTLIRTWSSRNSGTLRSHP